MPPIAFNFTARHLRMLRRGQAYWNRGESGAPGIFFGDELIIILRQGIKWILIKMGWMSKKRRYPSRDNMILTFIRNAKFETGEYTVHIAKYKDQESINKTINVTDEHLKLLKNTRWRYNSVNVKRPYGDFTYFEKDMALILGIITNENQELSEKDEKRMGELHDQLLFVLQAFLDHADLSSGTYFLEKE